MKAFLKKSNKFTLTELYDTHCGDLDIVIDMKFCGLCGSDIGNIFGNSAKPTTRIGHEVSGIISKVGKKISEYKIGDKVVINHHFNCGQCVYCKKNNQTMCLDFKDGLEPCGFSEKIIISDKLVKKKCIFKIPQELTLEIATLIEPMSCCVRAWKKLKKYNITNLAIFGLGPIGCMFSVLAMEEKIRNIVGFDVNSFRRNFFVENDFGKSFDLTKNSLNQSLEESKGIGFDCSIIATSDLTCLQHAIKLTRSGGIILIFGEPRTNQIVKLDISVIYQKEIALLTSYASTNEEFKEAIQMIRRNTNLLEKLITHKINIHSIKDAINLAKKGNENVKILIQAN